MCLVLLSLQTSVSQTFFFLGTLYFKSHKLWRPKEIDIIRESQNKYVRDHY